MQSCVHAPQAVLQRMMYSALCSAAGCCCKRLQLVVCHAAQVLQTLSCAAVGVSTGAIKASFSTRQHLLFLVTALAEGLSSLFSSLFRVLYT